MLTHEEMHMEGAGQDGWPWSCSSGTSLFPWSLEVTCEDSLWEQALVCASTCVPCQESSTAVVKPYSSHPWHHWGFDAAGSI